MALSEIRCRKRSESGRRKGEKRRENVRQKVKRKGTEGKQGTVISEHGNGKSFTFFFSGFEGVLQGGETSEHSWLLIPYMFVRKRRPPALSYGLSPCLLSFFDSTIARKGQEVE